MNITNDSNKNINNDCDNDTEDTMTEKDKTQNHHNYQNNNPKEIDALSQATHHLGGKKGTLTRLDPVQ